MVKTGILFLSDVFENFLKTFHKNYGMDPSYSFIFSGNTWSCMLKLTRYNLEAIQDVDMLMLNERGIRGRVSECCKL